MYRFIKWREIIQAAPSEAAVLRAMRDYVENIPPAIRSTLPAECDRALRDDGLQAAAITLMHCELTYGGDQAIAELLHEIAQTYAVASTRIARLAKEPITPAAD